MPSIFSYVALAVIASVSLSATFGGLQLVQASRPDFVVIGAGNSGCVEAWKLSQFKDVNVLLVSSGNEEDYDPSLPEFMNWWTTDNTSPVYSTDNPRNIAILSNEGPNHGKKRQYSPKCTNPGGCSGSNGQVMGRNLDDYNDAVADFTGDSQWSAANINIRRRAIESYQGSTPTGHGINGPINLTSFEPEPTLQAIKNVVSQRYGIPLCDSSNGPTNNCAGNLVRNIESTADGGYIRQNTYFKLIKPLLVKRKNLQVALGSNAVKLTFKSNDPTDVKCLVYTDNNGDEQTVCPKKEIIVAMGAIGTPRFLMINGFGDCNYFAQQNFPITCAIHNPNIGKHIKNQVAITAVFLGPMEAKVPTSGLIINLLSPNARARGETLTDMQFTFGNIATNYRGIGRSLILGLAQLNRYQDEGFINITSADYNAAPFISYNFGKNHPEDLETLAWGYLELPQIAANVTARGYPLNFLGNPALNTIPAVVTYIKAPGNADTNWHYTGSIRMGKTGDLTRATDSSGVIWSQDGTQFVKGLVVGDNSLTPLAHSSHASASGALDVGSTIADILIAKYGLDQ